MSNYQLSARFVAEEDRILLSVGLGDKEAKLWLTRRLVKLMWPILGKIANSLAAIQSPDPLARKEIGEFRRQAALEQADFATPYQQRQPLWETPLLPNEMVIKTASNGSPALCLRVSGAAGIDLPMDTAVHSAFCELIRKCVAASGWDLALDYGAPAEEVPPPRGLH